MRWGLSLVWRKNYKTNIVEIEISYSKNSEYIFNWQSFLNSLPR